jgi:hypothetical protein
MGYEILSSISANLTYGFFLTSTISSSTKACSKDVFFPLILSSSMFHLPFRDPSNVSTPICIGKNHRSLFGRYMDMKYLFPMGFAKGALIGDVFVVQHLHKTMLSYLYKNNVRKSRDKRKRSNYFLCSCSFLWCKTMCPPPLQIVCPRLCKSCALLLYKSCALASENRVPFSSTNRVPSSFSCPPNPLWW